MNQKTNRRRSSIKERRASQARQKGIRNIAFIVGGILILGALVFFTFSQGSAQNVVPPHVGAPLGDFTLKDINGQTVHLSDYMGRPVLINAWATWCPPCKAEMPLLSQYYQAHAQQGFAILAVNAGDPQSDAAAFASQYQLPFPVLLDPRTQMLRQMGVYNFPTSVLIGKDGLVKTIHIGMFTSQSIESELTPLVSQ